MPEIDTAYTIKDEAELRQGFSATHELALKKCLDHLDEHARAFIERSPFLCLGTQSGDGADVSPRGDPEGFVKVLDDRTLLIPDRPGNNRLDSLSNILANPLVGLLFIIPGFDDTLRINGRATLSRDPALLDMLRVNDRAPSLTIVVEITEVFLHCAKAFRRSRLWQPTALQDRKSFPSLMQIIEAQTTGQTPDDATLRELDDALEAEYKETMY